MYIFYKICKYDYDNPDYINDRMGIEDYVGTIGKDLENYFFWENHFVKVYQNYLKYFGDTVATKIFFSDICNPKESLMFSASRNSSVGRAFHS